MMKCEFTLQFSSESIRVVVQPGTKAEGLT